MTIGSVGVYILEVSILLILLYIFNKQLLGRETLHRLNRYLWLSTIFVAFALPLMVPLFDRPAESFGVVSVDSDFVSEGRVLEATNGYNSLSLALIAIAAIYILGFLAMVVYNVRSYFLLLRFVLNRSYDLARSKSSSDRELLKEFRALQSQVGVHHNVRYVVHDEDVAPFSWFNFVVISRSDISENCNKIVIHELAHVAEFHSLDVILLNIVTTILWFNPAAWLTKSAVQQVHEYCADHKVISLGVNAKEYQLLLIRKAVGARLYTISNSLNHSNLKNRITMMLKKKSSPMAAAKCLYAIPVAIAAIALFASPALAKTTIAVTEVKVTNYFAQNKEAHPDQDTTDDNVLYIVNGEVSDKAFVDSLEPSEILSVSVAKDATGIAKYDTSGRYTGVIDVTTLTAKAVVDAKFQGGNMRDFSLWVMQRVRYPEQAALAGVQGTVLLSFIVEKDGSIAEVEYVKSPDKELSAEAKRVVLSSSKLWTPAEKDGKKVRMSYELPVIFRLSAD